MWKLVHALTLSPPPREHVKVQPMAGGSPLPYEDLLAPAQAFLRDHHLLAPLPESIRFTEAKSAAVKISFQGNPSLAWADHYHVWIHGGLFLEKSVII